jgi:hypothetical protein
VDCSSVALDMTSFATFISTASAKAPIAQRGKARQKRTGLRIAGLGLVVTRDGGIPLTWHAYPGDKPDVTQFTTMIDQLRSQYQAVTAAAGVRAGAADMTVVFGAGQNSEHNFAHLAGTGLRYIGSVPASGCPDLTALPATVRGTVDQDFGALTAYDTRRQVYGAERRAILTHSPELHDGPAARSRPRSRPSPASPGSGASSVPPRPLAHFRYPRSGRAPKESSVSRIASSTRPTPLRSPIGPLLPMPPRASLPARRGPDPGAFAGTQNAEICADHGRPHPR